MDRITKSVTGEFSGCLDLVHRMNYRESGIQRMEDGA